MWDSVLGKSNGKCIVELFFANVEERLDLVEAFLSDLSLRRTIQDCLKIVPDYFRLSKKINRGKGSLQVLAAWYVLYTDFFCIHRIVFASISLCVNCQL